MTYKDKYRKGEKLPLLTNSLNKSLSTFETISLIEGGLRIGNLH